MDSDQKSNKQKPVYLGSAFAYSTWTAVATWGMMRSDDGKTGTEPVVIRREM